MDAQGSSFGIRMTIFPILLIKTSSPEKRNSLGSLTAWLRPFMNTLAVYMLNPPGHDIC
jgi:hypothetical protein